MREPSERDALLRENTHKRVAPVEVAWKTRYGIIAGLWIATFLSSANSTLVATVLSDMSSEFRQSHQASWLGTSYLLATCTFTPLYGRLCDIIGRRAAVQTAIVFSILGCIACASSQSMIMLIFARFLSGIGGGGVLTAATIVTSDLYDLRSRGLIQGLAMVCNSVGMGIGGPLGGLISDWFGWRWAFLGQLPLFIVSLILISWNLRYSTSARGRNLRDITRRIDFSGTATLFAAVLCFLLFLSNHSNNDLPWSNAAVYLPLTGSVLFSMLFIVIELTLAHEPVLSQCLLTQKVPVLIGLSNFFVSVVNFSVLYYFPMWFRTVRLTDAARAGAHLIPNGVSYSTGSVFAGWLIHRTGTYKTLDMLFGTLPVLGTTLLSMMREDSPSVYLWLSIIPLGFGNAVAMQTMLVARLAHLPESAIAVGTGFVQLFRGLGQVSGVAISSAVFQAVLDQKLEERIQGENATEIIQRIRRSANLVATLPPDLQRAARDSYADALHNVFILAVCASVLAYSARVAIPDKSLDEKDVDEDQNS